MTYASAFTRVCKTATERGWLSESVVLPLMSRKGEKGAVRPTSVQKKLWSLEPQCRAGKQRVEPTLTTTTASLSATMLSFCY